MKILTVHSDYIEVEVKKKAINDAEEIKEKKQRVEEVLVVFTAVEKNDEKNVDGIVKRYVKEIKDILEKVKAKNVMLYPYAHLSSNLSKPKIAQEILIEAEKLLSKEFNVSRAPFGWYKSFNISCKGHPLSELSREFSSDYQEENYAAAIPESSTKSNDTYKKLITFLDEHKAEYKLIDHPPEGRTEIVSPMRGNKVSQAAKCIIITVRTKKGDKHVLGVVPGDAKVDLDLIKELFQGTYASFASSELAEQLAGSVSGTILPFSFNDELELIVDPSLLDENNDLYFNAARLDRSVALKTSDYKRLAKPRLEHISKRSKQQKEDDDKEVSQSLKQEATMNSSFFILDLEGKLHKIEDFNFKNYPNLEKFATYETKKVRAYDKEPPHIKLMKEQELVDYEPGSDAGNFRFLPKGRLLKKILEEAISNVCIDDGALEVETPIMYDYEHPSLKKYLNRFPARQYKVISEDKNLFLRFAACFGQFLIAHDMVISHKQLPLKLFELTRYSFRREQSGELAGLKRLRAFTMPDMHTFTKDFAQAKGEFEHQYDLSLEWMSNLGLESEVGFRVQEDFFKENKDWYMKMVKKSGKPILVELFKERYAYFITKFEFNFVDDSNKASALSTVQIDVENCHTYDIGYTDEDGSRKGPLILHASISGSLERVIYALLEKQAIEMKKGHKAMFPTWLSPTQIRIIPVSEKFNEFCSKLLADFDTRLVRVDFDDRDETLGKKIRAAEKEWIPVILVVGDQEIKEKIFSVNLRKSNSKERFTFEEIVDYIEKENEGKPFRKLSFPKELSKRPRIR